MDKRCYVCGRPEAEYAQFVKQSLDGELALVDDVEKRKGEVYDKFKRFGSYNLTGVDAVLYDLRQQEILTQMNEYYLGKIAAIEKDPYSKDSYAEEDAAGFDRFMYFRDKATDSFVKKYGEWTRDMMNTVPKRRRSAKMKADLELLNEFFEYANRPNQLLSFPQDMLRSYRSRVERNTLDLNKLMTPDNPQPFREIVMRRQHFSIYLCPVCEDLQLSVNRQNR